MLIDPNKIIAYMAIEAAKESIEAIIEKLRSPANESSTMQLDAMLEIGKLRPWKNFEKSVLVILKAYPGLVELLQKGDLRDQLLLHDTGGGLLFAKSEIQDYLDAARISRISDTIKDVESAVDLVKRDFLYSAYADSVKSLFDSVRQNLDMDFGELMEFRFQYLQKRIEKKDIREFMDLQIPILEYNARLNNIFREIAIVCEATVNLLLRFARKLDTQYLKQHAHKILRTTFTASSSLNTLKGLCDIYNPTESYRFTNASLSIKQVEV